MQFYNNPFIKVSFLKNAVTKNNVFQLIAIESVIYNLKMKVIYPNANLLGLTGRTSKYKTL